jgi:dihydroneopterin aldolase
VETRIGVTEKERSRPQDVVIDLEIAGDLAAAGSSDSLDDTIDYDGLVTEVAALVRASECNLLERLASQIADRVAAKPGVSGVTVRVGKQHVPVDEEVSSISVSIERGSLG